MNDIRKHQNLIEKTRDLLSDGEPWTLEQLAFVLQCSTQTASARVRDLRKPQYGGHTVMREKVPGRGIFRYRLVSQAGEQLELIKNAIG